MILERTFGGTVEDILKGVKDPKNITSINAARILYLSAFRGYEHMLDEVRRNFTFTCFCGEEMIKNSADSLRDLWGKNPEEEGIVQVRVSTEDKLRVEVEDNGLGLSDYVRDNLFKKRVTTKQSSHLGGRGIGMFSSSAKIAALYGDMGYVEKDCGVIFWYELGLHLMDELNDEI